MDSQLMEVSHVSHATHHVLPAKCQVETSARHVTFQHHSNSIIVQIKLAIKPVQLAFMETHQYLNA